MQNNNFNTPEYVYAGFWVRMFAFMIDMIIVFFLSIILRIALSFGLPKTEVLFTYSLSDIVIYLFQALYFILFTFNTNTTPGKRLLNLRVVSSDLEGERLSLPDIIFRETVGRYLSGIFFIGYIMIGIDKEHRGFHDMLSDTHVIYSKKIKIYPEFAYTPAPEAYEYKQIEEPEEIVNSDDPNQ